MLDLTLGFEEKRWNRLQQSDLEEFVSHGSGRVDGGT
jgi:hypothetical protein